MVANYYHACTTKDIISGIASQFEIQQWPTNEVTIVTTQV